MTFVEVVSQIGKQEQNKLISSLLFEGVSFFTWSAWARGNRTPKPYHQERIQKLLKKHYDIDIPVEELFPKL